MTDCRRGDLRDRLPELVNDRLGAAERAEMEAHLASCPDCAAEAELLREMRVALSRGPRVDIARIAAGVRATTSAPAAPLAAARSRRPAWSRWRAAAGIAAVAVGVASWALTRGAAPRVVVPRQPAAVVASAPVAGANPATAAPPASIPGSAGAPAGVARIAQGGRGLSVDGGVSDLSDDQVRTLLRSIGSLDAVPDTSAAPVVEPVTADLQGVL